MTWKCCIGVILISFLLGIGLGRWSKTPPAIAPLPPLPPDVVTVEKVKVIRVPGPERVVERISVVTEPGPVREIETVKTIFEKTPLEQLTGRVIVDGKKYEGIAPDGQIKQGWKGLGLCQVKGLDETWVTMFENPFDLSESKAEEVIIAAPVENRKFGVGAGVGFINEPVGAVSLRKYWYPKSRLARAIAPTDTEAIAFSGAEDHGVLLLSTWRF